MRYLDVLLAREYSIGWIACVDVDLGTLDVLLERLQHTELARASWLITSSNAQSLTNIHATWASTYLLHACLIPVFPGFDIEDSISAILEMERADVSRVIVICPAGSTLKGALKNFRAIELSNVATTDSTADRLRFLYEKINT